MKINYLTKLVVHGLGLICVALVFSGCVIGQNHFTRSNNVAKVFENYEVLPGHQYHLFGYPHSPDALVAIQDGYQLTSPKWKPVDMNSKDLKNLVERMLNQPGSEFNIESNGARIFNDSGETIGAWYSVWVLPILRFTSQTEFTISDPITEFPTSNTDPENKFRYRGGGRGFGGGRFR